MATTIQNLESEVILKCENRTQDTARADIWIRDALLEISSNPAYRESIPELEVIGPLFNLIGGPLGTSVQEYAEGNLLTTSDFNLRTLQMFIWIDFPTNQVRKAIDYAPYQAANAYQSYPSLPTEFYRYGGNIGFYPTPNVNYQVQARYMRRHPFVDYFNTIGQLNTTPVLLPNEWFEVIEWCAAMRGFMELLEFDKAAEVRTMLFGDPAHPNDNPGLIKSIMNRRKAESWNKTQRLSVVVPKVGWGQ